MISCLHDSDELTEQGTEQCDGSQVFPGEMDKTSDSSFYSTGNYVFSRTTFPMSNSLIAWRMFFFGAAAIIVSVTTFRLRTFLRKSARTITNRRGQKPFDLF
jgi:hypothetical protein